jgi:hypothetical protein
MEASWKQSPPEPVDGQAEASDGCARSRGLPSVAAFRAKHKRGSRAVALAPAYADRGRMPSAGVAGDDDAVLVGEHDGLHSVAQAEFEQDAADVALDGRFGDDQPLADLAV